MTFLEGYEKITAKKSKHWFIKRSVEHRMVHIAV